MPLTEDDEGLAAELALGTLDAEEEARARRRVVEDAEFARAVADWERRLAPLSEMTTDETPPHDMLERLLDRLPTHGQTHGQTHGRDPHHGHGQGRGETEPLPAVTLAPASNVIELEQAVRRWKRWAFIATGIAAALLVVLNVPRMPVTPPPGEHYVAILHSDTDQPGFVAMVDMDRRTLSIRVVGADVPVNHSFELWALGAGRPAPESLGLVDQSVQMPLDKLGGKELAQTLLAVSLEPEGGSPTGQPTGPVLYTGRLLPAG